MFYRRYFKRLVDLLISTVGLILIFPVFIITSIILLLSNKGNPFFFQERPGKNEKVFNLIKFKTMSDATDENGNLLPDSVRLTKIGKFIRKYSIDELPQLINVLIGDMSIIGPRPLRTYYLPLYNSEQRRRHDVRPGITGWAQVNGRNTITWTKKFELDVEYVDNISFWFDIKILYLTILKVIKQEGINQKEDVTMEPFNGYN